ncbi:MAG TPA: L,D-transpeptidase [Bryobacteraceae bacterium]|nr:L,D-transpeptidase [Bryobacteraceae bacterium]
MLRHAVAVVVVSILCNPQESFGAFRARRAPSPKSKKSQARARRASPPVSFDPASINDASLQEPVGEKSQGAAVIRAQILLDRANFSVGEIDGAFGLNFRRAITGFQSSRGLPPGPQVDIPTWQKLNADTASALVPYKITQADIDGPYAPLPEEMMEKAKLPSLGYASMLEALGERFHVSPALLKKINASSSFTKVDEEIMVPNVATTIPVKAGSVVVSKGDMTVTALDKDGKVIAQYPATMGSEHDPLPLGTWKIRGVAKNPVFHYNPELFWDADAKQAKAKIAAGPNNPVGTVWIDLSKEHYGIHGTPEPAGIGHTQSHGCIRLTNWDAEELAGLVTPGTSAILKE